MNERENALKVLNHEIPDWVPNMVDAAYFVGFWSGNEQGVRNAKEGDPVMVDVFGVPWTSENGAPMNLPGVTMFDDICEWKDKMEIPDPSTWDWEMMRDVEMKDYDGTKIVEYFSECGAFDRLTAEMGFEGALCAMITDPEACIEFFNAIADYKIELIKQVKKYYNPDCFIYSDDIATSTGLFMSPDIYREELRDVHARIIKAIRDEGMIAHFHTCGKNDAVAQDYYDMGVQIFFPAQPTNDLVTIKEKFGDQFTLFGAFDTQGPTGGESATEDMVRAEAHRVIDTYAPGGGLISLVPSPLNAGKIANSGHEVEIMNWYLDEFRSYGGDFYDKPENRTFDAAKARTLQEEFWAR